MTIVFRFICTKVETRFSASTMLSIPIQQLRYRFCCSTCHGISAGGHRRHAREQIEVLILYYYYSYFYAIGRLGVGVAAVDIGQQPSCAHNSYKHDVYTRRGQLPVSLTQTIVQSARTRMIWCTVALDHC